MGAEIEQAKGRQWQDDLRIATQVIFAGVGRYEQEANSTGRRAYSARV